MRCVTELRTNNSCPQLGLPRLHAQLSFLGF